MAHGPGHQPILRALSGTPIARGGDGPLSPPALSQLHELAQRLVAAPTQGWKLYHEREQYITQTIIDYVLDMARSRAAQVARWAPFFSAGSTMQTLERLFAYQKRYVRYVKDPLGEQYIKEPARILADGFGDCKSYAVLTSAVLQSLSIPHQLRFVALAGPDFDHVYVIVNLPEGDLAFDPCLSALGEEAEGAQRVKDYTMTRIAMVAGLRSVAGSPDFVQPPPSWVQWSLEQELRELPPHLRQRVPGIGEPFTIGAAVSFIQQNPEATQFIRGKVSGLDAVFEWIDNLLGPCGWFGGWDHISEGQFNRVNQWRMTLGEPAFTEDEKCNWKKTVHPSRAATEMYYVVKATFAQILADKGQDALVKFTARVGELYSYYMNRQDPIGSEGRLRDYREKIMRDWAAQSRGDGGTLTIEQFLYSDSTAFAAREFGFTPNINARPSSQAPFRDVQVALDNATGSNTTDSEPGAGGGALGVLLGAGALLLAR